MFAMLRAANKYLFEWWLNKEKDGGVDLSRAPRSLITTLAPAADS